MRPVLIGDVLAAARVLRGVAPERREAEMAALLAGADLADRHRKRTGRTHPRHGNGSLMAAALARRPGPEAFLSDRGMLEALGHVIAALRARAE